MYKSAKILPEKLLFKAKLISRKRNNETGKYEEGYTTTDEAQSKFDKSQANEKFLRNNFNNNLRYKFPSLKYNDYYFPPKNNDIFPNIDFQDNFYLDKKMHIPLKMHQLILDESKVNKKKYSRRFPSFTPSINTPVLSPISSRTNLIQNSFTKHPYYSNGNKTRESGDNTIKSYNSRARVSLPNRNFTKDDILPHIRNNIIIKPRLQIKSLGNNFRTSAKSKISSKISSNDGSGSIEEATIKKEAKEIEGYEDVKSDIMSTHRSQNIFNITMKLDNFMKNSVFNVKPKRLNPISPDKKIYHIHV